MPVPLGIGPVEAQGRECFGIGNDRLVPQRVRRGMANRTEKQLVMIGICFSEELRMGDSRGVKGGAPNRS